MIGKNGAAVCLIMRLHFKLALRFMMRSNGSLCLKKHYDIQVTVGAICIEE